MRYHNLKSVLLAFVLVFFFGPFGLFYAGVGWGVLAILITFIFAVIGCGVVELFSGIVDGWYDMESMSLLVLILGTGLGYGVIHLLSLIVGPVLVHYKRQDQLDEFEELEAHEARAANRYRPKRRSSSYT